MKKLLASGNGHNINKINNNFNLGNITYLITPFPRNTDTRMALGAISACPALFPCKNALPLLATAWAWLKTLACKSRARRKELSLRDLAAKAQRQQHRNKSKKSIKLSVVSHLRLPTLIRRTVNCLKKFCSSSRNTFTC